MREEIALQVDPANPGQYFACCGLLELAHRMRPGAEAWFADGHFMLRGLDSAAQLLNALLECEIVNTMTSEQKRRRKELGEMGQKALKADPALEAEKKAVDSLWRESPCCLAILSALGWTGSGYAQRRQELQDLGRTAVDSRHRDGLAEPDAAGWRRARRLVALEFGERLRSVELRFQHWRLRCGPGRGVCFRTV